MVGPLLNYPPWLLGLLVFILVLVFIWIGIWYRKYEVRKGKEKLEGGRGALENSMLTLLGLLLAFTFGMALNKFENRRTNITNESNAIGTAILRCDLYPDSIRSQLRKDFRKYVESRIKYYTVGTDTRKIQQALEEGSKYSSSIWKKVSALSSNSENLIRTNQMVPAMNAVIDIVTTRDADRISKIPPLILLILLLMTVSGSFLVGYDQSSAKRSRLFILGFAFMTTVTIYLILELDRPRSGLINLNPTEKYVVDLRNMLVDAP